jgi:phage terminase large subunit
MSLETQIVLNRFQPRDYQMPICDALENKGYKKIMAVLPRRAGKDIVSFNLMIRAALRRVGTYYYILPTHEQARRVMFDGITSESMKIIDYIPSELIQSIQSQQMKITLVNGSIIQFCGSNKYDRLRGTNPIGVIFSEYSYQHPQAYPTIRPVLVANNGWAIFISTPFGENHFFTLYEIARNNPDEWFCIRMTVDDTKHMSRQQIQKEIDSGEMSPDMAEQEYYCSFSIGAIGSYYSKYLNRMELNDQIGAVEWEPNFPVHTAWDLGMRDSTCILFFQVVGVSIHVIDMYQSSDVGLEHYINVVQAKPYTYGRHIGPHDLAVREFTSGGLSRIEKANNLGIKFMISQDLSIIDGIESVRTTLPRMYIDSTRCKNLIAALRDYRKAWDAARGVYQNKPLHDKNSHIADALRYMCIMIPKLKRSTTPEELDKRYQEAIYGNQGHLPAVFRDDLPGY